MSAEKKKYRAVFSLRDERSSNHGISVYNFDARTDDEARKTAREYEAARQPAEAEPHGVPLFYQLVILRRIDQEEISTKLPLE
ncbi:MAG: hypothetical protein NTY81_02225 [Candidatus Staskawiczbacteria bacterium]|nr:hypothetical protein [Candidatus Staskawiczbacteria bacterium]